jgi:hypothetical protein
MYADARGYAVSLSQPAALDAYERAVRAFNSYRGDPLAPLDEALAIDEGFAAAYATRALMLCSFLERRFMREALATLERGNAALERATPRERALAAAARRIAGGDWRAGALTLDELLAGHPLDIVALQTAHILDFARGDAICLRNRVSRVLPAWSKAVPGYAYVLGMHAFGYEECNQYVEAERAGRRAHALSGDDSWAVHAVAHVMEMQGRIDEGIAWFDATRAAWAGEDNGLAYHNAWHLALFHIDRGEYGAALGLFDAWLAGGGALAMTRIDATALLWRLMLEGVDVGARFVPVAGGWEATLDDEGGFSAFNDFHAAMAFAATGRREALERLRAIVERAAHEPGDNAAMTRTVGAALCEAAIDYCEGRYAEAARRIAAVRDESARFGGSQAQRDLLALTLIEAATRAGDGRLARHFVNERLVHKPASAWGLRLAARAAAPQARRAA